MAGLADPGDAAEWLPRAAARRMSRPSRFAVAAARMAWREAGLEDDGAPAVTSVALATSFGPSSTTESMLREMREHGAEATSPFLFTECVANAPAAQVALALQARGANTTITQREAGPLLAVARGLRDISAGRCQRAVVGSVDEITPLLHSILARFGALARPDAGGRETARPFDRGRDGFLLAEGAAAWVLEREEAARARGARILARVRGAAGAHDPSATATRWGRDASLVGGALRRFLDRSGLAPGAIDRVLSGASGSPGDDLLEAAVLRQAWPDGLPPVLAPKGVCGEYGGGLLAAAAVAMAGEPFGPTAGFREPDPPLGVVPHDGRPLDPPRRVLVSGLACGGTAAWLVLERP